MLLPVPTVQQARRVLAVLAAFVVVVLTLSELVGRVSNVLPVATKPLKGANLPTVLSVLVVSTLPLPAVFNVRSVPKGLMPILRE